MMIRSIQFWNIHNHPKTDCSKYPIIFGWYKNTYFQGHTDLDYTQLRTLDDLQSCPRYKFILDDFIYISVLYRRKQAWTLFIFWSIVWTTVKSSISGILSHYDPSLGTRLVLGGDVVRETVRVGRGRVAMVLSPWMSAKFPRNAGLQGSRKQCTNNKVYEYEGAPSFVFKLMPWSSRSHRKRQFGCDRACLRFAQREVCWLIKPFFSASHCDYCSWVDRLILARTMVLRIIKILSDDLTTQTWTLNAHACS